MYTIKGNGTLFGTFWFRCRGDRFLAKHNFRKLTEGELLDKGTHVRVVDGGTDWVTLQRIRAAKKIEEHF